MFFHDELTNILISILLAVYVSFIMLFMLKFYRRRQLVKRDKTYVFSLLSDGFKNAVPIDESDIRLIYKRRVDKTYFPSYVKFIEEYLLFLRSGHEDTVSDFSKVNTFLKQIIERENQAEPYEGVDENERRLLRDIEESVSDEAEKKHVVSNLEELAIHIRSNQDRLHRSKVTNSWTIPISIIGLVLTLVMFIFGSKVSDSDLNKIEESVKTAIQSETINNAGNNIDSSATESIENGQTH